MSCFLYNYKWDLFWFYLKSFLIGVNSSKRKKTGLALLSLVYKVFAWAVIFNFFKNLSGKFVLKALDYSFLRSFVKMNVKMTLEKSHVFFSFRTWCLSRVNYSITILAIFVKFMKNWSNLPSKWTWIRISLNFQVQN